MKRSWLQDYGIYISTKKKIQCKNVRPFLQRQNIYWLVQTLKVSWLANLSHLRLSCVVSDVQKKRPPETLICSKSKMGRPWKLKLHQPVYLIRFNSLVTFQNSRSPHSRFRAFQSFRRHSFFVHPLFNWFQSISYLSKPSYYKKQLFLHFVKS